VLIATTGKCLIANILDDLYSYRGSNRTKYNCANYSGVLRFWLWKFKSLSHACIGASGTSRGNGHGMYGRKRLFTIYNAFGRWVGKDKISDSCWTMFSGVGVAITIPMYRTDTKHMYDRPLFVDNDNYERWIHCLTGFVRSVMPTQIIGWLKTHRQFNVNGMANISYIATSCIRCCGTRGQQAE
jgi:hypothetical protein